MTWSIHCKVCDRFRWGHEVHTLGPYATQNLARWWAVNFAQKGSIIIHQGQPDETVIPISQVIKLKIRED